MSKQLTQDEMREIVTDWATNIKYEEARRRARSLKRKGFSHQTIMKDIINRHGKQIAVLIDNIKSNGYYHYKNL